MTHTYMHAAFLQINQNIILLQAIPQKSSRVEEPMVIFLGYAYSSYIALAHACMLCAYIRTHVAGLARGCMHDDSRVDTCITIGAN